MTYATGGIIDDGDYNLFATGSTTGSPNHSIKNLNTLWTNGTGNKGYGQSGGLTAVSTGSLITATQWANLFNRITTIAAHQGTSISIPAAPTAGNDITAYNSIVSSLDTIWLNHLNCAASGATITLGGSVTRPTGWGTAITFNMLVQFGSVAQRRYFFNTGGRVNITMSRSGGSINPKNVNWSSLLNSCGTLVLTGAAGSNQANIAGTNYFGFNRIGGFPLGAETLNSNIGFHSLTTTYQTLFLKYDSVYLYTENYVQIRARLVGNNIEFEVRMVDADDDIGDFVTGSTNCTITATPAATTHISNSWGTVTLSGSHSGS